jgi:hypothetical protein
MTAINFPDDPTIGDLYTINGRTWKWTGTIWVSASVTEFEALDGGSPDTTYWGNILDAGTL